MVIFKSVGVFKVNTDTVSGFKLGVGRSNFPPRKLGRSDSQIWKL